MVSFQHAPKRAQSSSRAGTRSSFFVSSEFNTVTQNNIDFQGWFLMCERGKKARRKKWKKKWFSIDLLIPNDLFNSIVRITIYNKIPQVKSSLWIRSRVVSGGAVSWKYKGRISLINTDFQFRELISLQPKCGETERWDNGGERERWEQEDVKLIQICSPRSQSYSYSVTFALSHSEFGFRRVQT